jgi:hypothetical protein
MGSGTRSKLLAEQKAFELESQQKQWKLVTIQPPIVQGPPPGEALLDRLVYNVKLILCLIGGVYSIQRFWLIDTHSMRVSKPLHSHWASKDRHFMCCWSSCTWDVV